MPLEILYTVVPVFMIAVLFFYTAARRGGPARHLQARPTSIINVVGKQWSWDFNYVNEGTYEAGTHAELTGKPGVQETLPTLYLPVNKRTEFVLTSRDVIHSFWVPAVPAEDGRDPGHGSTSSRSSRRETGDFKGKCAELCGAYHSQMLFNVEGRRRRRTTTRTSPSCKAQGNTGQLDNGLSRQQVMDEDRPASLPNSGEQLMMSAASESTTLPAQHRARSRASASPWAARS